MNDSKNFAKDRPLHLAMRELQGLVRRAPFWIGFACVVTMLTVSAPFDTDRQFSDAERLVYWAGVAAITFAFGYVTVRSLGTALTQTNPRLPPLMAHLTAGLIAGPFIGVIVFAINVGIAGIDEIRLDHLLRLMAQCVLISICVSGLIYLARRDAEGGRVPQAEPTTPNRLQTRLTPANRGALMSLQSQDHYVEVVTSHGQELLLMRLADAIDEAGTTNGMQTHRSWWVARAAVARLARADGRYEVILHDGRQVPVSRGKQSDVLAWLG